MGVQPSIRQIGKYTVLDVIGTGGMGIVFRAQDPAIGRTVAIKMLKSRDAGSTQDRFDRYFFREMKSTGNLHHQNIVTVYDAGEHEGSPYLVMEYLEGEPVSRIISERRPMPLLDKLDLVIQVCDGLQYAHDRNVIHRDIKPANVILLANRTAKIVDFGVARIAGSETSLAQTGQLVGSLSYMSPEQINSLPIDGRSDIFSTGVMLYELLTYEVPFKGNDPSSIFVKILREDPLPLSKFIPDIPPAMQAVMNRALAKNAQDRYQSAEEFGFDLLGLQKDLKASSAADCLKRGEAAMQRGDLDRARVLLGDVIRLDRHHEKANRLLREIRSAIQTQQRSGQVIQIRSQAQVALAGGQFEEALACADQALRLNPDDTESIKLCDQIRNAISRAKAVRDALNRAEAALFAGDFDEAKEAIEESLRLDPTDSEARALGSVVNKELQERFRRQQVQEFVDQARQGIAERKFNDALDALHRAEELDPTDSNVRELLQWAQRGQEQENRRRYLQDITDQIEKALHAGEFSSACTISEMGLQQIPGEPTLIRLRAISEKQRDIAERRRFVHDQSLAVKALTDGDKLNEAVQVLTEALRKFPGEPNLESLLSITKAGIERQQFEREEVARKKAVQRADNEARAQLTQQVLNWSVELRRSLDARSALVEIIKISKELRVALDGKQIDDHAREVAGLVLNELNSRMRARDQATVELEHLHRAIERSLESFSVTETESRLLSIKAAFPNEESIQKMCADLAHSIANVREARDHSISLLGDLAQVVETTPTSELTALQEKARQLAAGIANDPRAGALLQQIDSSVGRRFERHAELVRDVTALLGNLSRVHSIEEISRISDRATAIAALDPTDDELAEQSRKIDVEAGQVRDAMESLLREMAALGRAVAIAPTIRDADALVPRVKALADSRSDFQTLQEAATRILAEAQGKGIEHDLIVQELEAALTSIPLLETDQELSAAASRAVECRELHSGEPAIQSLSGQVVGEVKRILRERSELHARQAECDNAIRTAEERLRSHELESALEVLLAVEAQNPDRVDLHLQISLVRRGIENRAIEKQRLEEEQRAREQAEAEQRARRRAIEETIQRAQELISAGQDEESLQCLRAALEREPGSHELESARESIVAEIARKQAEQEQLERARLAREQAEAEARARKAAADEAIHEARALLGRGQNGESVQCLRSALERDPGSRELELELQLTLAEIARQHAELERLAREAAEAQARKGAAEQAIQEAGILLAQGNGEESVRCLRSALERDPGNEELELALQKVVAEAARQQAERARRTREEEEARSRKMAAEQAIEEAMQLLAQGRSEESVNCVRLALERDAENKDLQSTLESIQAEIERRRAEQERLERERAKREQLEREKAEAEAIARKAAAKQAIEKAQKLFTKGKSEESLECLAAALERDPGDADLRSAQESIQAEVDAQRAEEARLAWEQAERERVVRELAEFEVRARKEAVERAIHEARKLLSEGRGEDCLRPIRTALEQYPANAEMQQALDTMQAEVAQWRAEQERFELERQKHERIAKERAEAEARARQAAAEQAVEQAHILLEQGQEEECLQCLHSALDQDPESSELRLWLELMSADIGERRAERGRLERERLELERIAREKAEAEALARRAVAEQAIKEARGLLADGGGQKSLERLRSALEQDPLNQDLLSTLESVQEEVAHRRAEQERLEREHLERERIAKAKAETETRERGAAAEKAIKEAKELLARKRGDESLQCVVSALGRDPDNPQLQSAVQSIQAELARLRVEQERVERERLELERIAKEKAAAEARARRAASELAVKEARELFAQGRGDESVSRLRVAIEEDPTSADLRSTLNSYQAEIARQRAEQERLERERVERERLAKDKAEAEARTRKAAAAKAIKEARDLFAKKRGAESLQGLRAALGRDPENLELQSELHSIQSEVARQVAEQKQQERERLERERIAAEKAEAEDRARKEAARNAIIEARSLLDRGRSEESLQKIRRALETDPKNAELRSTLDSIEEEVARQRVEQKRLERERVKEKAAADAVARKAEAEKKKADSARLGVASGPAPRTQRAGSVSEAAEDRKRAIMIGAIAAGVLIAGGIVYVLMHLSTPPLLAEVTFTVDPADSTLSVDGNLESCGSSCVLKLTPGRHAVKLTKPGFVSKDIEITVAKPPETGDPENLVLKAETRQPPAGGGTPPMPSLAILSSVDAGSVTLDRDSRGNLPGPLDLGKLDPGPHEIVVAEHGQKLTIQARVSDEGVLNVDGASGLNQAAVISVIPAGNEVSIYCRCLGAEVLIDGRKPKQWGHDRYSFGTHGRAAFNLTVQPNGNYKPIPIQVADASRAEIHVEPFVQIAAPAPTNSNGPSGQQNPNLSGTNSNPPLQPTPVPPTPIPAPPPQVEKDPADVEWSNGLKESRDLNALQKFRERFPKNPNARLAYERMDDLSWDAIKNSDKADELRKYVGEFSDGRHVSDANRRIQDLAKLEQDRTTQKTLEQDRKAVNQALEDYRLAYERKDLNALSFVWPSIQRKQYQDLFASWDRVIVTLKGKEPVFNGDVATVACEQTLEFVKGKNKQSLPKQSRLFTLRRSKGGWIIEKDN